MSAQTQQTGDAGEFFHRYWGLSCQPGLEPDDAFMMAVGQEERDSAGTDVDWHSGRITVMIDFRVWEIRATFRGCLESKYTTIAGNRGLSCLSRYQFVREIA